MNRREFITALSGAAAWPLAARAQQTARVRRVGIFMPQASVYAYPAADAFKRGLAGLGWVEGRNIRFQERYPIANSDLAVNAKELARLAPDAIFVLITLQEVRRASGDIPIVFAGIADPVEQGFVSSLARPGGNITGFADSEFGLATKRLDLLKKLAPSLERVALLYGLDQPSEAGYWAEIQAAAPSLALKASKVLVRKAEEIAGVMAALAREPNSGLLVAAGPVTAPNRELIATLAMQYRLPTMHSFRPYVEGGGLASYGPDRIDQARRAAAYVDRILRGESPRDLPVQQSTKFEFVLNLKTAKAMGLDVPANVLALADAVIE